MNKFTAGILGAFGLIAPAQAVLHALVDGQVYDDALGISWLQDTNLAKTLCDVNDALWQGFNPLTIANNSGRSKAQICTDDGKLNWYEAEGWIAHLNASSYKGYDTWRQPATAPVDGSAFDYNFSNDGSTDYGYNISAPGSAYPGSAGSELAYMHYNNLGNEGWLHTDGSLNYGAGEFCSVTQPWCLQNNGPFQSLLARWYWLGTEYVPDPTVGWFFGLPNGRQGFDFKVNRHQFVWPVHPGQADAPTVVPAVSAWGLGLMGLLLAGLARWRLR